MTRLNLCLAMTLGLMTLCSSSSAAQDAPTKARFDVTVIHATQGEAEVDPALETLSETLKTSFKDYQRFKKLLSRTKKPAQGVSTKVKLPDGKTATFVFNGLDGGFIKVQFELDGFKTQLRVRDGGLFFQAGRVYKGGILVLAVEAHAIP